MDDDIIASKGGIIGLEGGIIVSECFNRFRERHHCSEGGIIPSEGGIIVSEGGIVHSEGGIIASEGDIIASVGSIITLEGGIIASRAVQSLWRAVLFASEAASWLRKRRNRFGGRH